MKRIYLDVEDIVIDTKFELEQLFCSCTVSYPDDFNEKEEEEYFWSGLWHNTKCANYDKSYTSPMIEIKFKNGSKFTSKLVDWQWD